MLYVYVITESGALTLTSTKLQIKHRSALFRHEIKEKKKVMSMLFPLISLTWAACHIWNLTRWLEFHDWAGEGLRQSDWVPLIEPALK